jgi:hypothetical protein
VGWVLKVERGDARVICKKPDIHPKFFSEAKCIAMENW